MSSEDEIALAGGSSDAEDDIAVGGGAVVEEAAVSAPPRRRCRGIWESMKGISPEGTFFAAWFF